MNSDGFLETEGLMRIYSSGKIKVVALDDVNKIERVYKIL